MIPEKHKKATWYAASSLCAFAALYIMYGGDSDIILIIGAAAGLYILINGIHKVRHQNNLTADEATGRITGQGRSRCRPRDDSAVAF